jgi:hypothetical protein
MVSKKQSVKRYDCYYPNDFNDEYRAFSRESPDGDWVAFEDYDALAAELAACKELLLRLANAADAVGVEHFDTDTMSDEVREMQSATLAARAADSAEEVPK